MMMKRSEQFEVNEDVMDLKCSMQIHDSDEGSECCDIDGDGAEEEEKEAVQIIERAVMKASSVMPVKPVTLSFDDLLMSQSSSTGAWSDQRVVLSFFSDLSLEGDDIRDELLSLLSNPTLIDQAWLTILALYVLSKKFGDRE